MNQQVSRQVQRRMQRNAEAVDQAVEGDRRFFRRFPYRRHRVRPMSSAERAQIEAISGGTLNLQAEYPVAFVAMKQIAQGTRLRITVFGPEAGIGEELTEDEARAVWEGYAARHPEVRRREADMLALMERLDRPSCEGKRA